MELADLTLADLVVDSIGPDGTELFGSKVFEDEIRVHYEKHINSTGEEITESEWTSMTKDTMLSDDNVLDNGCGCGG